MKNQEIMPTLNFEEHHSKIGFYLKTGRLAIEHKSIPVSADDLKPLYEALKSHFEKPTTRMATLTIPHDNC